MGTSYSIHLGTALLAIAFFASSAHAEVNENVASRFKQLQPEARAAEVNAEAAFKDLSDCIGNSKNGRADCPNEVAKMDQAAAQNQIYTDKLTDLRATAQSTGDTTNYRWFAETSEDRTAKFNAVEEVRSNNKTQNVSSGGYSNVSSEGGNGGSSGNYGSASGSQSGGSSYSGGGNSSASAGGGGGGGSSSGGGTQSAWKL